MDPRYDGLRNAARRRFLRKGAEGLAALLGASILGCDDSAGDRPPPPTGGLGPLQPPDGNGIRLPAGFTSRIVAQSGLAPVPGGAYPWHAAPDGGATFPRAGGGWIYVSNSEMPGGTGGAGALRFDAAGNVVDAYSILAGTTRNCAGGKMPWGTWLSCEESGETGLVYECDPAGIAPAAARPALGRFNHEAAAWDSLQSRLYLTEDRADGGLYRFTPPAASDLSSGTLEVARVVPGPEGTVTWLAVPDPDGSPLPVRQQVPGMTPFSGGEGIAAQDGTVYFATTLDNRVWSYDVASGLLVILYDFSTSATPILTGVDNLEISPAGDLLVAEDGGDMQIVMITPSGAVVPLLEVVGQAASEITGPAFAPGGGRLYFSSQRGPSGVPAGGITYEVAGPFAP
jgi:secreted PhoX family phosphatase